MRLLTKTTIYFLAAMVTLLGLAGFYLFHQFSGQLNHRSDEELIGEEIQWIQYLESEVANGTAFILRTRELSIFPSEAQVTTYPLIRDAGYFTTVNGIRIPYRQLSQVVSINGIVYQITIKKSQEQKVALANNFTRIMLFVFGGLFLSTLIFLWAINRSLWAPFQRSLEKIRNAELQKMQAMHFEKTGIKEFNELNTSLNYMAGKIYNDFVNMKEFTENAAHEMQTPIAVVQSKLELLLQDSQLNDQQAELVLQATDALGRLGKLNQGLLLLAKIGGDQYTPDGKIGIAAIMTKYLSLFNEMIINKQLSVEVDFAQDFKVLLHPFLADSLVTNLLGNAIKYNYTGGTIRIRTSSSGFEVSNSSAGESIQNDKLFKRFNTSKGTLETTNGLGLAIVKKITDSNNLRINYRWENGLHTFMVIAG